MSEKINAFVELAKYFSDNGYKLYLVGGTVRDFFLNVPLTDMDLVTDATPSDMDKFLPDADYTFSKYGSIKYVHDGIKFDITTLRKERRYIDRRHPQNVKFVKSLKVDVKRRDFTINAMYLDDRFKLFDFYQGKTDLDNKIIKMIGNPNKRIKEDPLRILRALRFAINLDFNVDPKLEKVILKNISLVKELNADKIKQELFKINPTKELSRNKIFTKYNLSYLIKGE